MQRVRKFCRAVDQPKMTPIKQLMQVVFYVQGQCGILHSQCTRLLPVIKGSCAFDLSSTTTSQPKRNKVLFLYPVVLLEMGRECFIKKLTSFCKSMNITLMQTQSSSCYQIFSCCSRSYMCFNYQNNRDINVG